MNSSGYERRSKIDDAFLVAKSEANLKQNIHKLLDKLNQFDSTMHRHIKTIGKASKQGV